MKENRTVALNVKTRIAVAMTIVLAVNILAGGTTWWLSVRAADHAAEARDATERARWVGALSESVTVFVSETNDLALGLDSDLSAEGSSEYGDVTGVDADIAHLISIAPDGVSPSDLEVVATEWQALRTEAFVWVNAEAEAAGWPTRLTIMKDDKVRASVDTNIEPSSALAGLGAGELRREVRKDYEAFRDRRLRGVMREAEAQAQSARTREISTRATATVITVALFGLASLVAAAVAVWLYRTIATPLNRARVVADAVTRGEFDRVFDHQGADEIGSLVHAVEAMRDAVVSRVLVMREMAGAVLVTADGVAAAVRDASDAVGDRPAVELTGALALADERTRVLESLAAQMLDG